MKITFVFCTNFMGKFWFLKHYHFSFVVFLKVMTFSICSVLCMEVNVSRKETLWKTVFYLHIYLIFVFGRNIIWICFKCLMQYVSCQFKFICRQIIYTPVARQTDLLFFGYKDIFVETNYVRLANRHFILVKFFANKCCPRKW